MPVQIDPKKPHDQALFVFRSIVKPDTLPEEFAPAFAERAAALERDLVHHLTKFNEAKSSTRFTRAGQVDEIRTLTGHQLAEIQKTHTAVRSTLDEQITTARAAALVRPASTDDAATRYLKQQDVVDYFAGLDPLARQGAIRDAVREKDLEFIDALITAPRFRKNYDTKPLQAAREQLADESNPEIAKLVALRDGYDRVYQTAATIVRETAAQAGVQLAMDPIRPQAK